MLQQPLGNQHHEDALAAALRVPDDTTFVFHDSLLRGLHAEVLMHPGHLLPACVEEDKVTHQIEQARLLAHLGQRAVE